MEITWVSAGSSWFWIRSGGKSIHIDPAYRYREDKRGKELDERAHLVLITHAHSDHWSRDTLAYLRGDETTIVAPHRVVRSLKVVRHVHEVLPGKEIDLGWAQVKAVAAYNLGFKGHTLHRKGKGVGYLLKLEGKVFYHSGDTDLIPEMKDLGNVDIAFLPIGGTFTMDVDQAAEAAKLLGAKVVIPMHNLKTPSSALQEKLKERSNVKVEVLEEGKPFEVL